MFHPFSAQLLLSVFSLREACALAVDELAAAIPVLPRHIIV